MEDSVMDTSINLYDDLNWEDAPGYPEGTLRKMLRDEGEFKIVLLKLQKGFRMAAHSHINGEHHFLIKGEYRLNGISYGEGTFMSFAAHESHGPFESESGAIVLVVRAE
jgi:anti-sigma factor ChrR (cupin superfamily)